MALLVQLNNIICIIITQPLHPPGPCMRREVYEHRKYVNRVVIAVTSYLLYYLQGRLGRVGWAGLGWAVSSTHLGVSF